MAPLRTHNPPSERKKNDLGEVDEAMFQGVEMQCEIIFLHPLHSKKQFGRCRVSGSK
jgi:hypothetical protein